MTQSYPPPQGYSAPQGYPPPGYPPPGFPPPGGPYGAPQVGPVGNGMATAALICGLVSLILPILGIVAIILGAIGLSKSKDPEVGGRGKAVGGIVSGVLGTVLLPSLLLLIILPGVQAGREATSGVKCGVNMRRIGMELLIQASNDRAGRFPADLGLLARQSEMTGGDFVCPSSSVRAATGPNWHSQVGSGAASSYVYLRPTKYTSRDIPSDYVLLYEPLANHDGRGANFLRADGTAAWHRKAEAERLIQQLEAGQNPPRPAGGS